MVPVNIERLRFQDLDFFFKIVDKINSFKYIYILYKLYHSHLVY